MINDDGDAAPPTPAYRKHGRDTPDGRARYRASRRDPCDLERGTIARVTTAEGVDATLWRSRQAARTRTRGAVQIVASEANGTWDTVVRCCDCWRWTSRVKRCDECDAKKR